MLKRLDASQRTFTKLMILMILISGLHAGSWGILWELGPAADLASHLTDLHDHSPATAGLTIYGLRCEQRVGHSLAGAPQGCGGMAKILVSLCERKRAGWSSG